MDYGPGTDSTGEPSETSQEEAKELLSRLQIETFLNKAKGLEDFASTISVPALAYRALDLLPDILGEAERAGIQRSKIARACQITEGTVSRWATGQVQPHFLMAQSVVRVLSKVALSEAAAFRARAADADAELRRKKERFA